MLAGLQSADALAFSFASASRLALGFPPWKKKENVRNQSLKITQKEKRELHFSPAPTLVSVTDPKESDGCQKIPHQLIREYKNHGRK